MEVSTLYYCDACGAVFVRNYRDSFCPVCRTAMKWRKLDVADTARDMDAGEAPHEVGEE